MELCHSVRKCFENLGIVPIQSNQNSSFNSKNLFVLMCLLQMFLSSLAYLLFEAKSIGKLADSFYMILTSLACAIFFSICIWKIANILQLIREFEQFIGKRSTDTISKVMYIEQIEKIERLSRIVYIGVIKLTIPGIIIPALSITLINFFVYHSGDDSFFLPFPVMLPFNWKTPLGYFIALIMQCMVSFSITYADVPVFCFLFQSCQLLKTFVQDISKLVSLLDDGSKSGRQNQSQYTENVIELARNFSTIKQFVNKFNDCYEYIVTDISLWANLTICSTLLTLQFELSDSNLNRMELLRTTILVIWAFAAYFVFSECGEMVTSQFEKFNDALDQCSWYLFSIETQKMFAVVVANSQPSINIRGYGNVLCARKSFKTTCQTGFSYFTMLRQIDG